MDLLLALETLHVEDTGRRPVLALLHLELLHLERERFRKIRHLRM